MNGTILGYHWSRQNQMGTILGISRKSRSHNSLNDADRQIVGFLQDVRRRTTWAEEKSTRALSASGAFPQSGSETDIWHLSTDTSRNTWWPAPQSQSGTRTSYAMSATSHSLKASSSTITAATDIPSGSSRKPPSRSQHGNANSVAVVIHPTRHWRSTGSATTDKNRRVQKLKSQKSSHIPVKF